MASKSAPYSAYQGSSTFASNTIGCTLLTLEYQLIFWEEPFNTSLASTWQEMVKSRNALTFAEVRDFYSANNSENRLLRLTPGMLTKDSKKNKSKGWPKLRAKAGECRSLISFTRLVVEKHCDKDTEFEVKLRQASRALEGCYELKFEMISCCHHVLGVFKYSLKCFVVRSALRCFRELPSSLLKF